MTYRDLKEKLSKLNDKQLNQEVLFIPELESGVPCNDEGDIDYSLEFRIAQSNMYKSHVGSGPCSMCMSDSMNPACEIMPEFEEQVKADDWFVKAYEVDTPYFLVGWSNRLSHNYHTV